VADEELIKSILETHNLDSKLQEKIIKQASKAIDKGFLNDFDSIYTYVDYLVEKFNMPYLEKFALSLDRLITSDSTKTFHDLFGEEDENLATLFEQPDNSEEGLPIEEAISILGHKIKEQDMALMQQLLDGCRGNFKLNWSPNELRINISQIKERIAKLKDNYGANGDLIIPKRPIVYVQLNKSLIIKFGNRRYEGNPLAFFLANRDVYVGMGRTELAKFDGGLYDSLRREKQLDIAIPEIKEASLSEDEVNEIIAAHDTYEGNAKKAAKYLPWSDFTIAKYWKREELQIRKKGSQPLSEDEVNEIVAAYDTCDKDATKASKYLSRARNTIVKYWRRKELQLGKGGAQSLSEDEVNEIVAVYDPCEGSATKASKYLSRAITTILKYWREAGLDIRKKNG